ncbi:MAG: hypothetical protein JO149_05090 [Gammaproteobacteria bacterium]|nr:hypothetical protein [Gammaproteobacteria bacterium]
MQRNKLTNSSDKKEYTASCSTFFYQVPQQQKLNLTAGEVYYLVGNPILIMKQDKESFRSTIPSAEVINSFPTSGSVILIESRQFALEFSRAKQHGSIYKGEFSQAAIAAVRLRSNLNCEIKFMQFELNENHLINHQEKIIKKALGFRYIETYFANVEILYADLEVQTLQQKKTYPSVQFAELAEARSTCIIA